MPFNAFTTHRPSAKTYPERKANPELPMASGCRRATDGCEFHPWTLGFRQSSFSPIGQALQDDRLHVFDGLPLYEHALVPSPFRVQVSCSPRRQLP